MHPAVAEKLAAKIRAMSRARRLTWLANRLQICRWKQTMTEDADVRE